MKDGTELTCDGCGAAHNPDLPPTGWAEHEAFGNVHTCPGCVLVYCDYCEGTGQELPPSDREGADCEVCTGNGFTMRPRRPGER